MGRTEIATASIGIKIRISVLVSQINKDKFELIKEMLEEGIIEDANDDYNDVYANIIYYLKENITTITNTKKYLVKEFKDKKSSNDDVSLWEKDLLVPIKKILTTERCGYDRYGVNGGSRAMDFDLSVVTEKYKTIENIKIVFILEQSSY